MIRFMPLCVCVLAVSAAFAEPLPGPGPATTAPATAVAAELVRPATPAERQLAAALVQLARPGFVPKDVPLHLRRASALCRLAIRLDSQSPLAYSTLAEASAGLADHAAAAQAAENYLRLINHGDYDWFARYLGYRLEIPAKVEARLAMLQDIAADEQLPPEQRALALADQAVIEERRGNMQQAGDLYKAAHALAPNLPVAARGLMRAEVPLKPVREGELLLAALRGNPLDVDATWDMARLCRRIGAYPQALVFYDHARKVAEVTGREISRDFDLDYLNALLDAGLAERAVQEFVGKVATDPINTAYAGMLVDAYRRLGQTDKADALVDRMAILVKAQEETGNVTAPVAAELAWFYHIYSRRSEPARQWAATALRGSQNEPLIQRIWAMVMMDSDQAKVARAQLKQLAPADPYAAADMADYEFRQGNREAAMKYVTDAVELIRKAGAARGRLEWQLRLPWRYLQDVAQKHGARLSDDPEAPLVAELVGGFDAGYLEMGQHPERFVQIRLAPQAAEARPGEPLRVEAVLTNVSKLPVPVGGWGLIAPRLVLEVRARGPEGTQEIVQNLPLTWAAPRYVGPGASLRYVVSLDTGPLHDALFANPLATYDIAFSAIVDPVEKAGKLVPSLQALKVEPIAMRRLALVGGDDPAAYWTALVGLVQQLRGTDEAQSMRAAETTVSLLAMVQGVAAGRVVLGPNIAKQLREPELLSMLKHCLQEAPPAVQGRTLLALESAELTPLIQQLLQPCLQSPDANVRACAADLIGQSKHYADKSVLARLAETDLDPLVRAVAEVYKASAR